VTKHHLQKKKFIFVFIIFVVALSSALSLSATTATKKTYANWNEIAREMTVLLNRSYEAYFRKDVESAKNLVNEAYFGLYEKEGFERTVMAYISGKRGSHVEYQFPGVKTLMTDGAPNKDVRLALDYLIKLLQEDANALDGKEESGLGVFFASLMIILREGLEAILVIASMAAYLTRAGIRTQVRTVYLGSGLAVVASIVAAFAMQKIFQVSGANQEIIEGVSMLLASAVLFFVSNWMLSKAEAEAWKGYIQDKVRSAVAAGNGIALGAAAFLAVFREGAETILFYQAMLADVQSETGMVWAGLGVGCAALVVIFAVIRYGSLRLPLKPFFIGTSIVMYILSIAFAGGGIKELQEGDVIGVTPVNLIPSVDLLGIYPTVETLLPQAILVLFVLGSIVYYRQVKARDGKK
jgi:high-affinity iron transporter